MLSDCQFSDYHMVLTGVWRCITTVHGVQCVMMTGTLQMVTYCAVNWDMEERRRRLTVQLMDKDQDKSGWMMFGVRDQRKGYPAARSEDGEVTIADTTKMLVLYARLKVSCIYVSDKKQNVPTRAEVTVENVVKV